MGGLLGILAIVGVAAGLALTARRGLRASGASSRRTSQDQLVLNVEIPPPRGRAVRLFLSCPHCDFELPFDDPTLVGECVECPACESLFLILEPVLSSEGQPSEAE